MENKLIIPLLCAAALAYACGPWRNSSGITESAASVRKHATSSTAIATTFDVISHGDRIDFTLSVANNTKKTVELRFPTSQTHDFKVLDTNGNVVWQWSKGRIFTQAMQSKVVKSKDTLTIANDWDISNAHGEYIAVATLITDSHSIERRVAFQLP